MRQYKIFALKTTKDTVKYAQKQTFRLITPEYILIYTDKRTVRGGCRVNGKDLIPRDISWVQACNDQIVANELATNQNAADNIMSFLDSFEEELKKISAEKGGEASIGEAIQSRETAEDRVRTGARAVQ